MICYYVELKMFKYLFYFLILIVIETGCSKKDNILTIGIKRKVVSSIPFWLALNMDKLPEDYYNLKYYSDYKDIKRALIKNKIDIAILPFHRIYEAKEEESDIRVISFLQREGIGMLANKDFNKEILTQSEKVGVINNSVNTWICKFFLKNSKILQFSSLKKLSDAYHKNEIDFICASVPEILNLMDSLSDTQIYWLKEKSPLFSVYNIATTKNVMKSSQKKVKLLNEILENVTDIMWDNPFISYEAARDYLEIPRHKAEQTMQNTKFLLGLEAKYQNFEKHVAEQMVQENFIKNLPADLYLEINKSN